MTRQRWDDNASKAELWRRKQREISSGNGFDAQDMDFIWHDFKRGRIMTVEDKEFLGNPSFSQMDTHGAIARACEAGFETGISNKKGFVLDWKGHYLVQYEKSSPADGYTLVKRLNTTDLSWSRPKKLDESAYIEFLRTMLI